MTLRSYDINNHSAVFGAIPINSGFGPDTVFEVKRESAAWDDDAGADGEVTRSKNADDRATCMVTLMQSSRINDLLSAHYVLDRVTPGGIGAKPFLLKDNGGTTLLFGEQAWLKKSPDQTRAKKVGQVVWEIRIAKLIEFHGGNT